EMPVEVLCEDHSGTYQLPFACRFVDGRWHNDESGDAVEATVIGWRLPRVRQAGAAGGKGAPGETRRSGAVFLRFGTRFEQSAPESVFGRRTHLFTARYRHRFETAHNIQHEDDGPQPTADDKG